jgi:hypothetical protein
VKREKKKSKKLLFERCFLYICRVKALKREVFYGLSVTYQQILSGRHCPATTAAAP